MAMERWRPHWGMRPWESLRELQDMLRIPLFPAIWKRMPSDMVWAPAIEMFEKEDKFVVKAELPGMSMDEVDVSLAGDVLMIKGERKAETEVNEEDYYCCERSYGNFSRTIALPSSVDADKIEACFDEGVLEVVLPKIAKITAKKIELSAKSKEKKSAKSKAAK